MVPNDVAPAWEKPLRPWRWASALIAFAQLLATLAALGSLTFSAAESRRSVWIAAGAVVALEMLKWLVEREGLRRAGDIDLEQIYAAAPLDRRQRQLVAFNLALFPGIGILALSSVTTLGSGFESWAVLVVVLGVGSFPSLYRIWRRNSWLAITRLPSRARKGRSN